MKILGLTRGDRKAGKPLRPPKAARKKQWVSPLYEEEESHLFEQADAYLSEAQIIAQKLKTGRISATELRFRINKRIGIEKTKELSKYWQFSQSKADAFSAKKR